MVEFHYPSLSVYIYIFYLIIYFHAFVPFRALTWQLNNAILSKISSIRLPNDQGIFPFVLMSHVDFRLDTQNICSCIGSVFAKINGGDGRKEALKVSAITLLTVCP